MCTLDTLLMTVDSRSIAQGATMNRGSSETSKNRHQVSQNSAQFPRIFDFCDKNASATGLTVAKMPAERLFPRKSGFFLARRRGAKYNGETQISLLLWGLLSWACLSTPAAAQEQGLRDFPKLSTTDWPWWRGPTRNGIAIGAAPTKFSDSAGVLWKTPVPGRGHSSPIVVGQRVFLTTADTSKQIHSVLAFDRGTGEQLWQIDVSQGGFPKRNHPKNTEATPTIASDGERLWHRSR